MSGLQARTASLSGSERGGRVRVYRGAASVMPARNSRRLMTRGAPADAERRKCPSCHLDVPMRADGDLWNHRIGATVRQSWPCPGDHPAPR